MPHWSEPLLDGVFNGQRLSHLVVLWGDFFFFPLVKAPGCFSQETPGIKVGVPEMVLGGGKQVWFIPTHAFPAFVHTMLIWAVGVLWSEVSGILSPGLVFEEQRTDKSGETPDPSKFLVSPSVVLGEGACLLQPHV